MLEESRVQVLVEAIAVYNGRGCPFDAVSKGNGLALLQFLSLTRGQVDVDNL